MADDDGPQLQIKAERDRFILVLDPQAPFDRLKPHLEQRIHEARHFLRRTNMILDLRERPFQPDEIRSIRLLLDRLADIKLEEVRLGRQVSSFLDWVAEELEVPVSADLGGGGPPPVWVERGTCRSGARIEAPGDCVVLGDVNPGAEVVAAGDIIVFGALRGTAHAGAGGNRAARILALEMDPHQLRIADVIGIAPEGERPRPKRFEVAEVCEDRIEVTTH